MLVQLFVKNLALIDSAEVEFGEGLNILTGETGAGKSVLLGSVNVALGGKASKDWIRQGCDSAYVELVFSVENEKKKAALLERGITPTEDNLIIISKKIMPTRSISRINDETVTAARLREITGLLIDVHGQHDHQSLLYPARHLEILDEYGKNRITGLKETIAAAYRDYAGWKKKLEALQMEEDQRFREMDFLRFQISEMETADLKSGEEERCEAAYRKFANSRRIAEGLSEAYRAVSTEEISRALRSVEQAAQYDEGLKGILQELSDVDGLLSDLTREISSYLDEMTFDEAQFQETERRLDLIRNLENKYGGTIEAVHQTLEEKRARLEELETLDVLREEARKKLAETEAELETLCAALTRERKAAAAELTEKIKEGLRELNFLDVCFAMEFRPLASYTANGRDEAEFLISTNLGEPVRPLGQVASGGELSRIMLAMKTVLAETDDIPTLIFDEIDAGISGRTAQMVSEKLRVLAKRHQVLCITHLPQIAAMADRHFEIKKSVEDGRTVTRIRPLSEEEMTRELARLLGGAQITPAVLQNARELKALAKQIGKG